MTTTVTSHRFRGDVPAAMRAAERGPVVITDHGRPSHVLLTVEEFDRITGEQCLMGDVFWREQDPAFDTDLPQRRIVPERDFDL